jgi:outer membrane protein TolC
MYPVRLLALLLLGAATVPAVRAAAENVDLPERVFPQLDPILRDALQQSPRVLLRNLDLEIARGDEMQAKAGQYPSIGGGLGYSRSRETREDLTGSFNTSIFNYSLGLTQPVWHWGVVRNNTRLGEIRRKIAEQQYTEAYRLLAQEIRASYVNLIVRKATTDNARFNLQLAEAALKLAEEGEAKGSISGGQIFQIRMSTEQTRLATDRAIEDLEQARRSFRNLTGGALPSDDRIPTTIPRLNAGDDEPARLLAEFLSQKDPQTSALILLRNQLEVASLNLENQRKRLYPKVNFTAGIAQNRQSYSLNVGLLYGVEDRYVGMSVSWQLFDGFATRGAIRSALASKRQLEANYRQLTEHLAEDAQRQEKQLEFALRQMRINDRLFEDRGFFLKAREDDFRRGTVSETDLNGARSSFNYAQIAAYGARAEFLQRLGDFLGVMMEDPVLQQVKLGRHE